MSETLDRLTAALADRYAIEGELGQGGMATVYLAQDLKHDRSVALKVLRPELAAVIGAERFLNEIKVTANLQHPHILPLHDSGDANGFLFYVMPHVEGESLREKLKREKQLGIEEAIELTRAIASALDYAHRHGVVHRDIKPENILLHDGQPVVADFGIALAVAEASGTRLTETGLSLGTPHYMSPEQAMGDRELDARSDVYSLGAMLYGMLTGDPPYTGSTAQAIVAKVITEKAPPLRAVRDTVPEHVAAAVATALNKLPADRFTSAQSFAEALANPAWVPPQATAPEPPARTLEAAPARQFPKWAPGVALVVALGVGVLVGTQLQQESVRSLIRYGLPLEAGADDGLAISPDGSLLVYAKRRPGPDTLFSRSADALTSDVLVTAINIDRPFFSPDGRRVGYFGSLGQLLWVGAQGTPPVVVTDSALPAGGSWGDDGNIYFILADGRAGTTLARIPEGGGAIERVHMDSALTSVWPHVLPGSRGVVLARAPTTVSRRTLSGGQDFAISVLDLGSGEIQEITRGVWAKFAPPGHLLYQTAGGVLFALPFDLDRLEATGVPIPVADSVADFAVSASGTLVFQVSVDQDLAGGAGLGVVTRNGTRQNLAVPRVLYRNL
ncbi:MAG: serine/threonine-protein kinase, partial [bacterium]